MTIKRVVKTAKVRQFQGRSRERLPEGRRRVAPFTDKCRHREHDVDVGEHRNHTIHEVISVVEAWHRVENDRVVLKLGGFRHDEQVVKQFRDVARCIVEGAGVVIHKRHWSH
ncbi:MAG: hypothetical protein F2574_02020 [Actinobacteria bacterium]|nr:hypothetical protein [Actinomycetota bacterium]